MNNPEASNWLCKYDNIWLVTAMQGAEKEEKDFKDKREKFSKEIRKSNRLSIISKRRELTRNDESAQGQTKKEHIVDDRYADYIQKFTSTRFFLDTLPELAKAIQNDDIIEKHYGVIGIRKILSAGDNPPIQPVIDIGVIPKLVEFAQQDEHPQLQLEATWALTNVASGNYQQCESIVDKGTIPIFIRLLKSQHMGIVEQAIWALGNIASDSSFNRDAIIRNGGVQNIIYVLHYLRETELKEYCLWALSNLCRGTPLPSYELIQDAIPILARNLATRTLNDESVVADCCWAIYYNTKSQYKRIQILLDERFHTVAVDFLSSNDIAIVLPMIRVLSRMTSGNSNQLDMIMEDNRLIQAVTDLLEHDKKAVRVEACWVLANIAAGRSNYVNALIRREDTIGRLLRLFETDSSEVREQVGHFFANLTICGQEGTVFNFFKSVNITKFYLIQLSSDDPKLIKQALQDLYTVMKLGDKFKNHNRQNPFTNSLLTFGCIPILEQLQLHHSKQIYESVYKLMRQFFEVEDELSL